MTGMGKEGCLESVARTRFSQAEKKLVEVAWAKAVVEKSARRQRERSRRTLRGMQAFWRHESWTIAGRETHRYDSRGFQFELPRKCRESGGSCLSIIGCRWNPNRCGHSGSGDEVGEGSQAWTFFVVGAGGGCEGGNPAAGELSAAGAPDADERGAAGGDSGGDLEGVVLEHGASCLHAAACAWRRRGRRAEARVDSRRGVPWWGAARVGRVTPSGVAIAWEQAGEGELPHLANAAQEERPRTRRFLCRCVRHEVLQ